MLIFRIVHWFNFNFREYVFVLNNFFLVLTLFSSVLLTSLVAQTVKCLLTMQETWVQSLGQEDPLEKEIATHSSTLAWKIPWTEEHGRLQSMGSQRVGHEWETSLSLSFIKIQNLQVSKIQQYSKFIIYPDQVLSQGNRLSLKKHEVFPKCRKIS